MNAVMERIYDVEKRKVIVTKGEVWLVQLEGKGSVQAGLRPCVIVSNNIGNYHAPVVQVAPITSSMSKHSLPTHVHVSSRNSGLMKDSIVYAEQINTVDKSQLKTRLTKLNQQYMDQIDTAIKISFALQ